ncbi:MULTISPECIES: 2-oxoglutarate dehydrogenase E1 component [Niastella]|uniref:oxoglutarate dehydrogenase (succinyl-transferring) n=1 Tax=Niastella soli TaxID=2821487 RepID=A0ABS3YYM7_9BACT|nr:2-oxoglutarate dehydrogenase E1 component [Niastella soli]MBO9202843.1 2-oxoglutarate dehydrogenase E1 component [Niastella soli]
MDRLTYLNNGNAAYINSLYEAYQHNPDSIEVDWQHFFEGFDFGAVQADSNASFNGVTAAVAAVAPDKEINVLKLIDGYRSRGHLFAKTNPVRERRQHLPGKNLETFGLNDTDLDKVFNAGVEVGLRATTLREIRQLLEETYCGPIGVEYKYIGSPDKIKWFQDKMESVKNKADFSLDEKKRILHKLNQAVVFEAFLQIKFLGQKRFSLEGGETLIPALDLLVEKGAGAGVEEFVIGMGHRGRLNVLANIMGKPYKEIFEEFQGKTKDHESTFSGDVKYHLGYSNDIVTPEGRKVHLSVCANPSHLEAVNAVVEGIARSKADSRYDGDHSKIVPILLHGDASIAGQGIVYEVLQMENLAGFRTGGTIHLVINNQVGFTTDFKDARSSIYCTDLAKMVSAPVFHVNGDDAEALAFVIGLAFDYRQTFHGDVFIDILCYRKYGHNESDEPRFTQPLLYKSIDSHPNSKEIYVQKLIAEKTIPKEYAVEMEAAFRAELQSYLDEAKIEEKIEETKPPFLAAWQGLRKASDSDFNDSPETAISEDALVEIGNRITTLPTGKIFLKKTEKVFDSRRKMVTDTKVFDWAMGELLAYGSLLMEGHLVRLTGEDVKRGTFSHRHAVARVIDTDEEYVPLNNLGVRAKFEIYNSLLSEYGVMGFEYGYASANPTALVVWEAQYGDFLNTGQVIIDQYIVSAEAKWKMANGLVMLLPHGYEGAGPEHTSARIERFMTLCANNNMQLVNCTTPANFFHALRRQLHRDFRIPLVVFAPKSLLRNPLCVSPIDEFTKGKFRELIDDPYVNSTQVKRVLFCSGKIYYDLFQRRQENDRTDVAIVRIEQLYPTPFDQMQKVKEKYSSATEFIWVQEEPENMGAWPYLCRKLRNNNMDLAVIARGEASSPATGFAKLHAEEQMEIINRSFERIIK